MPTKTILPKKGNQAFALDDDHHEALAADPHITEFPQGSTFGDFNATTNISNGTTVPGFASTTGFGASGFGSTTASPATSGFGRSSVGGSSSTAQVGAQQDQSKLLQSSGGAMQEGAESLVANDKDSTDWINKKMRPAMGWVYMLTCTCDFIIFPILWSLLQTLSKGQVTSQWQPLTLQGAGLYHIAMGAVLGIAAYGRTKEKVAGVA